MNIFADFQARVAALIEKRIAAGELPDGLDLGRFVVEPPRDAAHGDLSTNAAMVYAKEAKAAGSNPRALAEELAADLAAEPDVAKAEVAGPGFINIVLKPEVYEKVLRAVLHARGALWRGRAERGGAGQCRICQRQSHRPDACRARARRRVRRRAREPARLRRAAGRRANITSTTPARRSTCSPARPSCATARRLARHRHHSRGALSRRLSEAGRAMRSRREFGAGAEGQAGGGLAAAGARRAPSPP